jgi:flagellar protein FliL
MSIIVIAIVAILAAGLAAGGAWFFLHRSSTPSQNHAKAGASATNDSNPVVAVYPLDQFVVNLADADHPTFLRIGIDLGLSKKVDPSETTKDSPYTPQLRDAILGVLCSYKANQLLQPDGKDKLKAQLLSTLRKRLPVLDVTQILFTDFVVQE